MKHKQQYYDPTPNSSPILYLLKITICQAPDLLGTNSYDSLDCSLLLLQYLCTDKDAGTTKTAQDGTFLYNKVVISGHHLLTN